MAEVTILSPDRKQGGRPTARRVAIGLSAQSEYGQFLMPSTGIQFPRQLPYEKWLDIGRQLAAVSTSSAWCLGDWLVHGEDAYRGRYRDAIEQTCLDYQTLRNYAWVSRRFALYRRRGILSFAHHAEVAGLPEHEQDFWLRKAEEFSWSRNRLRKEVRASLAERTTAGDSDATHASLGESQAQAAGETSNVTDSSCTGAAPSLQSATAGVPIQVKLSPPQLESCQAAADKSGRSIEEWAAIVLDRAARAELGTKNRR